MHILRNSICIIDFDVSTFSSHWVLQFQSSPHLFLSDSVLSSRYSAIGSSGEVVIANGGASRRLHCIAESTVDTVHVCVPEKNGAGQSGLIKTTTKRSLHVPIVLLSGQH